MSKMVNYIYNLEISREMYYTVKGKERYVIIIGAITTQ